MSQFGRYSHFGMFELFGAHACCWARFSTAKNIYQQLKCIYINSSVFWMPREAGMGEWYEMDLDGLPNQAWIFFFSNASFSGSGMNMNCNQYIYFQRRDHSLLWFVPKYIEPTVKIHIYKKAAQSQALSLPCRLVVPPGVVVPPSRRCAPLVSSSFPGWGTRVGVRLSTSSLGPSCR